VGLAADRVFGDNSRHTSALSGKRLTGGEGDGIAEIESRIAEIESTPLSYASPRKRNSTAPAPAEDAPRSQRVRDLSE
jgi:hypothetical protein